MHARRNWTSQLPALVGLALLAACGDTQPVAPPTTAAAEQLPPSFQTMMPPDSSGEPWFEYEPDTGNEACPAILRSHVKYWVNINAVGPRLFTFFAPHVRLTYIGRGVYRYRMTLGRSDDNEWLAEGTWTGQCIGYGQWGIGRVVSFEGTVWRVASNDPGCGGGGEPIYMESFDPYSPGVSEAEISSGAPSAECGGGGGGGGDGGGGGGGISCYWEWMEIEISRDGGQTWEHFWSGWGQVCENEE